MGWVFTPSLPAANVHSLVRLFFRTTNYLCPQDGQGQKIMAEIESRGQPA